MANKTLRITFSGISTLTPPPPRNGEERPEKAFVLMAANRNERQNQWKARVPPHAAFIYVPVSILAAPIPKPGDTVEDEKLGMCNIYYIDHARVAVDTTPSAGLDYYVDEERQLAVRPGSIDVAPEHDIRWLADIRDILPEQTSATHLRPAANPQAPGSGVAVVVDLSGGTLKANFPCKSVQPKTFEDANGNVLPNFRRVLATEFFIDMPFPESAASVKLRLTPLHSGTDAYGIDGNELTLQWGQASTIDVRMGNDTKEETKLLTSVRRCDARFRKEEEGEDPVLIPRDDDFDLHYELLNVPAPIGRRLPQTGPHQTQFDGCAPLAAR